MKKRLRSPAVLLVVFAMVVTTAGIVYAHWTTTTYVEGQIDTGNIHMGWEMIGTDDDGNWENDPTGTDDGGGTLLDWNGEGSSDDPSSGWPVGARYDKDVAGCWADGGGEEGTINWQVGNAYPSYYCHLFAKAVNHGSVPVKATALRVWAEKGTWFCTSHFTEDFIDPDIGPWWSGDEFGEFLDWNMNGEFDGDDQRIEHDDEGPYADNNDNDVFDAGDQRIYNDCNFEGYDMDLTPTGHDGEFLLEEDITLHIEEGILCGTQIDPGGEGVDTMGWIHVEQPADPNTTYLIHMEQDWVNWNEFAEDMSMCTFNGELLYP